MSTLEYPRGVVAAGVCDVPSNQIADELDVFDRVERLEIHHLTVAARANVPRDVEHVGDAAGHARGEIPAGPAEHDDAAAGHVLAAVIADALDNGERAAVAHGEPLARDAAEVRFAARRAVQRDVADDDVVLGNERRLPRREHDDLAAREPLADVIVRVAFELERDASRNEGAEALAGRAGELERIVSSGNPAAP